MLHFVRTMCARHAFIFISTFSTQYYKYRIYIRYYIIMYKTYIRYYDSMFQSALARRSFHLSMS